MLGIVLLQQMEVLTDEEAIRQILLRSVRNHGNRYPHASSWFNIPITRVWPGSFFRAGND